MRRTLMPLLIFALLASCSSRPQRITNGYALCREYVEARGWTQIIPYTPRLGLSGWVYVQGRPPVPGVDNLVQCQVEGGRVVFARVVAGAPL